jgi:Fe-Mn family superoxide dismutase
MVKHSLPELPYALDALAPHVSAETLEYHWGKHHRGYVDTLNRLLPATPLEGLGLEDLVRRASGGVLNQAAQHFNHSVYWLSLSPKGGGEPGGALLAAMRKRYDSFSAFRTAFSEQAAAHFGSGWAWLVRKPDGSVQIELTHDAGCPLTSGDAPLLVCDLWEHALPRVVLGASELALRGDALRRCGRELQPRAGDGADACNVMPTLRRQALRTSHTAPSAPDQEED